jgi:integrase
MPPLNSGQITEHVWHDGQTVSFGARVRAYGRRYRLAFGASTQGWNRTRAEIQLEEIERKISRGTWIPPERKASRKRVSEKVRLDGHQLFGPFARKVADAKESHGLDGDTIADLEWKLGYLIDHFGQLELLEIDVAKTDEFRDELAARSRTIQQAADRGKPLMETIRCKSGNSYTRRKRALSNTSINGILTLLAQILQRAADYDYIPRNPLKVGERRERYLPSVKPKRTFLEVDELHALLDAAGELDDAARRDHRIGRRAALATLALSGFRISELCNMLCQQVDLDRSSAAFTLQVYQQTRHRRLSDEERQAVWQLMRFTDEPEACPFVRHGLAA